MVFRYFRTKPPWPQRQGELALCEAPGLMLHPGLLRSKRTFGIDADLHLCAARSVRRVSRLLGNGLIVINSRVVGNREVGQVEVRTARPAIPEPPKIRPLAFCTLRIDFICALCCLSAFTHYGFILMSQKNPETESVRDQQ